MPAGPPSKYRPEFAEQAFKLCLLGAIASDLANFFDVALSTVKLWKTEYPEFLEAVKAGGEKADAEVASKLYHRARGYSHDAVKIVADANTGKKLVVPYTEHYPPDTTAAIFWLKNRRPELWRDRYEHKHNISKVDPADIDDAELADIARRGGDGAAVPPSGAAKSAKLH